MFPSLLREGSYSTLRMGFYEPFRNYISNVTGSKETSLLSKILAGAGSGAVGAAIANPTGSIELFKIINYHNLKIEKKKKKI